MKKFYLLPILCLLFITDAFSQCGGTFYDGFESGTYTPTWSLNASHTAAVTTTSPAVGSYRLELSGNNTTHLMGLSTSFTPDTPTQMSWYVYPSGTQATNYVVLGDAAVTATNCIVFSYYQGSSTAIRFVSSVSYNHPITQNTWYFVELRNVNWSAHTFDIWINGVSIYPNFPFRSATQNNVSRAHLYNFNPGLGVYDDIRIGQGALFTIADSIYMPLCHGDSTGNIDITVSGASTFTYSWNTGATTEDINGIPAGTYEVFVTDSTGCTDSLTSVVGEPAMLAMTSTVTDANCNGSQDGAIDMTPAGGTGAYTYSWSTADTTQDISNLMAGNYSATLTDANGCQAVDAFTVNEPSALYLVDSTVSPLCNSGADGSIYLFPGGGIGPYSYMWGTGDTTSSLGNLPGGDYAVTVSDANGCTFPDTVTVIDPAPISVSVIVQDVSCNGGSDGILYAAGLGGTGFYTYLWSTGGTADSLAGLAAGFYSITLTDGNGCTGVTASTVSEPSDIGSSGLVTDETSGDGAVDLTVTGGTPGYTFNWSNSATTEDISGLTAGTYIVTITDANGCTHLDTFVVDQVPTSIPDASGDIAVTVYPNPFTDEVTWTFVGSATSSGPWFFISPICKARLFTNPMFHAAVRKLPGPSKILTCLRAFICSVLQGKMSA